MNSFQENFVNVIRQHYFDTVGRARRREYWMFTLFFNLFYVAFLILDVMVFGPKTVADFQPLASIFSLALLAPSLALSIRRMHDTGRSGWWILAPVFSLVFLFLDSDTNTNKWGPNPKVALPTFSSHQPLR